ncbi:2886_t:CDS:10, partial [Acaulospora morrowiae]
GFEFMNRFTRVELTSSLRPVLAANETILATQDNVGLYDGNEKSVEYANGVAYLTTHRVVYVDSRNPTTHSHAAELRLIKGREFYAGFGIVKSSPKITLKFSESVLPDNNIYSGSPYSSTTSLPTTLLSSWLCPICSYKNQQEDVKCRLCGVKRSEDSMISPTSQDRYPHSKESVDSTSSYDQSSDEIGIECPKCTFLNHPSMNECEMCGTKLGIYDIEGDIAELTNIADNLGDRPDFVKLAFRGGGSNAFYEKLKVAMSTKEWEKTTGPQTNESNSDLSLGGISAILNKAEQNKKEQEETLTQAFKDLDGLMAKAAEVVKLVESINNRVNKEPTDSESSIDETNAFRTYLLELGIPNPVTKAFDYRDSAGSIYHKELARELAEFLEKILVKENGMMALTDIYCIFNRARGVSLISPDDLYKACSLFESLNLPMRLRNDEQTAQHILEYIKTTGPLTAIDLASFDKMSIALAIEQLQMVEAKGLICRDETVEGVRFYENLIINFKWEKLDS